MSAYFDDVDPRVYELQSSAAGPAGELPLTPEMLLRRPSGDLFGWTQDAGMGWAPGELGRREFLLLSTKGGIRAEDGTPVALGYHTGHFEVGLLVEEAAREIRARGGIPFAGFCTDPCDGRSQGTSGMFDSLPYRNDAAIVLRRLIRSLPTRRGVLGVATCDKGHPAMMMALAGCGELPSVLVPGGVMLPAEGAEDTAKVQTLGARYAHGLVSLADAARESCRSCGSPGGGCHFLGTAATSQVVGEALGLSLPHSALSPSGQPVWRELARQSARALLELDERGLALRDVLTEEAVRNAMVVHAAFGGSTNLLLHLPAVAHAASLRRPTVEDWAQVNRETPRLVSVLPNGPVHHPTVRVFLAGGVPEVMLHLRRLGLLHTGCTTAVGRSLGEVLDEWEESQRRRRFQELLREKDGVPAASVILDPDAARRAGMTGTVAFPVGNLAPEGSVVKSGAIDSSLVDEDGVYRRTGPARVFTRERDAVAAIKSRGADAIRGGDVIVLAGCGPAGTGMEETYQVTSSLTHTPLGRQVAVVTDARFSGVSTGACIGHVAPEALAGGPIGKLLDGDLVEIVIDRTTLQARLDLVGRDGVRHGPEWGSTELLRRAPREDLAPDPRLPDDTRLWAALQQASGGSWGGCVYDLDAILRALGVGSRLDV
ncbi:MAG TPA: YjhG/YagF family D-xylonate dehydratase [Vicinamibacteria bacterium]|nr:YjhG/YagF family D-xylonate dehydratase [Vicinamibacteria bacterium]